MHRAPELFLRRGAAVQRFALAVGRVVLGRSTTCDVVLDDDHVSHRHAELMWDGHTLQVRDLGSANGTFVDASACARPGSAPAAWQLVEHGQTLRLAATKLRVLFPDRGDAATQLMSKSTANALADADASEDVLATELHRRAVPTLLLCIGEEIVECPIDREVVTIGRDASCTVVMQRESVSRVHARIEYDGQRCLLIDEGSRNGVRVNGARVTRHPLVEGDTVHIGAERLVFVDALTEADAEVAPDTRRRRPVVVLPGFMGSELWRGSERVWPDWTRFVYDPAMLRVEPSNAITVGGIVQEVVIAAGFIRLDCFSRLTDFLVDAMGYTRGVDLLEFSYDWRRDIRLASARLAEAINVWQARESSVRHEPITMIAHSMGTLVARHYLDTRGGHTRVDQFVALGGPHLGLPDAVASLTAGARMPRVPLPQFRALSDRMRESAYGFESMYQLVPEYPCVSYESEGERVPLSHDDWLPEAHRSRLALGRDLRNELRVPARVKTLSVVGYGQPTVTHLRVSFDASRGARLQPLLSASGDGLVPTSSASLAGSDILPVRQTHASLFVDRDVRRRLRRMLYA